MSKEKLISLKEAAEISGYSPDYIGQLIRKGKLQGKQVFSNVVWMTTEDSILGYIDSNKKGLQNGAGGWREKAQEWIDFETLYKGFLGIAIALLIAFGLFLGAVVSISIDRHIDKSYQQQIEHGL